MQLQYLLAILLCLRSLVCGSSYAATERATPAKNSYKGVTYEKMLASTILVVTGLSFMLPAAADGNDENEARSSDKFTIAVYGDAPYGCKANTGSGASDECPAGQTQYRPDSAAGPNPGDPRQIEATPTFINAVNADPKVRLVLHTGDIHSGSGFCTLSYNRTVFNLWKQFKDPVVYTPGDNEWADCQKSKEGGGVKVPGTLDEYVDYAAGHPVANLALIRSMFFPEAGKTLGQHKKQVISQAEAFDPAHPADAEYVENVMWVQSQVLFVTVNIPGGSNNDDDQWATGAFGAAKSAPQIQDQKQRTDADLRWLEAAFAKAQEVGAKAVVITEQADMWDLDGTLPGALHIAKYEPFINKIAEKASGFGKPVLLINGDSHKFRSDNPMKHAEACTIETGVVVATAPCSDDAWDNHANLALTVPNFHRLVVHGSTFPLEYLGLNVEPLANYAASGSRFGPFSWERVIP